MKFTSIGLFILLLLVLLISVIFSKYLPLQKKEGFIGVYAKTNPTNKITVPQYSSLSENIIKLYDNIGFDPINGNIIEISVIPSQIYGNITAARTPTTIDVSNISGVWVVERDGTTNANQLLTLFSNGNVKPIDSAQSKLTMKYSYGSFTYRTQTTNTDPTGPKQNIHQVIYVAWGNDTYVHIVQNPLTNAETNYLHLISFSLSASNFTEYTYPTPLSFSKPANYGAISDVDSKNNNSVKVDWYQSSSRNVYQLNKFVYFDLVNGNLVKAKISEGSDALMKDVILKRADGTATTDIDTAMSNTNFLSWATTDHAGNIVVYMSGGQKAVVLLLKWDANNILKVTAFRFTPSGLDRNSNTGASSPGTSNTPSTTTPTTPTPPTPSGSFSSQYAQWLAYWASVGGSTCNNYSEDYILKTQVVPPVCPSCPSCSNKGSGVCTNCGGQGGSGTKTSSGSGSDSQPNVTATNNFVTTADPSTIGGATTASTLGVVSGAQNITGTAGGVVNKTVDTTGKLLQSAGSGTSNLLQSAGSGASNLLQSAGSGASNLLQSAGSGASNLLQSAGSGVSNILSGNNANTNNNAYGGSGGNYAAGAGGAGGAGGGFRTSGAADNYNYYGALPERSSNYIPITADFSAFGR